MKKQIEALHALHSAFRQRQKADLELSDALVRLAELRLESASTPEEASAALSDYSRDVMSW